MLGSGRRATPNECPQLYGTTRPGPAGRTQEGITHTHQRAYNAGVNYTIVLRSRTGVIGTAAVSLVGVVFLVMLWQSEGAVEAARSALFPITLAYFTWWIWAWPQVKLSAQGVQVRNQLRTFRIGWDGMEEAEASYGLYLKTADRRPLYAAAVPARGGLASANRKSAPEPVALDFTRGPRQVVHADPASAARLLNDEKSYAEDPALRPQKLASVAPPAERAGGPSPYENFSATFNWLQVGIMVLLAAGTALSLLA